jgi:hypothetical protein
LNGMDPLYLSEQWSSHSNSEPRQCLRSSSLDDLHIPRSCNKFGDRSFVVCGPKLWNTLPVAIRNRPSVEAFKESLKTFIFKWVWLL